MGSSYAVAIVGRSFDSASRMLARPHGITARRR
jgi:hypothetical protein